MILFKKIKWKNLLSTGNAFTEIELNKSTTTLISGGNGNGKCVRGSTEIDIQIKDQDTKIKFEKFLLSRK